MYKNAVKILVLYKTKKTTAPQHIVVHIETSKSALKMKCFKQDFFHPFTLNTGQTQNTIQRSAEKANEEVTFEWSNHRISPTDSKLK